MIFNIKINNEITFNLCEWNYNQYGDNPVFKLQTDDFEEVKNAFTDIELIEVFQDNIKIHEYTIYDTYSSISYLGNVLISEQNIFVPCIEVQIKKANLVNQVQRLEEAINGHIDIDSMTVDEYKNFVLKQISDACTQDIYSGTTVEINGVQQNYSFKAEDQINLLQLYLMTKMYPTITAVPYHSDGNTCMFYTAEQIQTIYMTLITKLITITTYANQLNLYANTLETKEELSKLEYGMELPETYAEVVSSIVEQTLAAFNEIIT